MSFLQKPCLVCGELTSSTRCEEHQVVPVKASSKARGYDASWQRLSVKARTLQPFCSDCGTDQDLTADHSPEAWRRRAAGLPIRLCDVDVCCRGCNTRRGKARGEGVDRADAQPLGKAPGASHTPWGM